MSPVSNAPRCQCFRPLAGYELFPQFTQKIVRQDERKFSSPCGVRVVSILLWIVGYPVVFSSPCGVRVVSLQQTTADDVHRFRPLAGYELFHMSPVSNAPRCQCFRPLAGYELFPQFTQKIVRQDERKFSSPCGVRVVSILLWIVGYPVVFSSPCGVRVVSAEVQALEAAIEVFVPLRGTSCFFGMTGGQSKKTKQVFVPLRGTSCFVLIHCRRCCSCSVFVPLRGTSCFEAGKEHIIRWTSFRPLAGYELFPQVCINCILRAWVFVPLRGTSCFRCGRWKDTGLFVTCFRPLAGYELFLLGSCRGIPDSREFSSPCGVRVVSAKKYKKNLLLKQFLL